MARRKKATITDALGRERSATRASWGKIRKLPSGRLQASYVGPDERRHTAPATFDARAEAEAWLGGERSLIVGGTWRPPAARIEDAARADELATETLGAYAEQWLKINRNRRGEPLRPRTLEEYRRLLAGPLADLAAKPLAAIAASDVDSWYDTASRTGRLTQASRAYSLLSTILKHAVERGRIDANPCRVRGAQTARTGKKVIPPTDAQLDVILAAIAPEFRALVWVAAEGGLRWGEATELRRRDVDIERADDGTVARVLIRVERAVTRTADGFIVGEPKSEAGVRNVYVYGSAATSIASHLQERVGRFGDPLLFPAVSDDAGVRHLSQSGFHTPHWKRAREAAGRPDMPFHALRHRAGTAYTTHGATMAEAMRRLGHGSTRVAMRYQHGTDERDAELAARMAR